MADILRHLLREFVQPTGSSCVVCSMASPRPAINGTAGAPTPSRQWEPWPLGIAPEISAEALKVSSSGGKAAHSAGMGGSNRSLYRRCGVCLPQPSCSVFTSQPCPRVGRLPAGIQYGGGSGSL